MAMDELGDTWLKHLIRLGVDPNDASAKAAWNALPASRRSVIEAYIQVLKDGGTLRGSGGKLIGPVPAATRATL